MNIIVLLPLLLLGSVLTFLTGKKAAYAVAMLSAVLALALSVNFAVQADPSHPYTFFAVWMTQPSVHVAFTADGLSLLMILLTAVLLPCILVFARKSNPEKPAVFYSLIVFMAMAMMGTFMASDGLLYYIFWELSLLPIYFIALLWGSDTWELRKNAVFTFFIYTIGGSLFMLAALAYLYSQSGSFLWQDWTRLALSETEQFWIFLAFFLAYAIKIPLVPFHSWQARLYRMAPAAGTMLLSGIMLKMGLYSVLRWQLPIAPEAALTYRPLWVGLSLTGVIYGSITALRQGHLKTLLAYSSLAHVGLIAAGCYTLTLDGLQGAVAQMIAHGLVIVALFGAADMIERRKSTLMIAELGGIRAQNLRFASLFLFSVFASIALPGTYNFVGEFTVLFSLSQINLWWAVVGGLTVVLGAYYMLRMYQHTMLGTTSTTPFAALEIDETLVMVFLLAILLVLGVYAQPLNDLLTPSLQHLITLINR